MHNEQKSCGWVELCRTGLYSYNNCCICKVIVNTSIQNCKIDAFKIAVCNMPVLSPGRQIISQEEKIMIRKAFLWKMYDRSSFIWNSFTKTVSSRLFIVLYYAIRFFDINAHFVGYSNWLSDQWTRWTENNVKCD